MIKFAEPYYFGQEEEFVLDAVKSKWISGGDYITKLEDGFKEVYNTPYVILTSNGTSALQLALTVLDLRPYDDEIIFPNYCFQAGANVALQLGLKPVFADINLKLSLDYDDLIKRLNRKTKAIVNVYNYGCSDKVNEIRKLAENLKILLVEDCAEALFTKHGDNYLGTFGDVATFSFHATKTLTTGEGGMFITKRKDLYDLAKLYHSHGLEKRGTYNHILAGNNFRMSNINAALGYAQFLHRDEIIQKKLDICSYYDSKLRVGKHNPDVLWSYPIIVDDANSFYNKMLEKGIETRVGFVPAHRLKYFRSNKLPVSEKLNNKVVALPMHLSLTENELGYIVESTKEIIKNGCN